MLLPHVHVHVVPRSNGDLEKNDAIYDMLGAWSPEGAPTIPPPFYVPSDEERKPRTYEQMAAEASGYVAAASSPSAAPAAPAASPDAAAAAAAATASIIGGQPLPAEPFQFGRFQLDPSQLFYASLLSVAIVNLKPLCPGHVLVVPKRNVPRMVDLSDEERRDLWRAVREVQAIVMGVHGAEACKVGVQDGEASGQSVPHVHVHVLPQQPPQRAAA